MVQVGPFPVGVDRFLRGCVCVLGVLLMASACSSSSDTSRTESTDGRQAAPLMSPSDADREQDLEESDTERSRRKAEDPTEPESSVGGEQVFSPGARPVRLDGLPTKLSPGPEPSELTRFVVAAPTAEDERVFGWDAESVLRDPYPPGAELDEVEEAPYASPPLGALNHTAPWGDQLLVSATDLAAVISFDRRTLEPRGYIPFEAPEVDGEPAGQFIPAQLAVLEDVAFLSFSAKGRAGVFRLELTTGSVRHRIYGDGASPQLCAVTDRIYVIGDLHHVLELDPDDLTPTRKVEFREFPRSLSCSDTEVVVGMETRAELQWVNRLTMKSVARAAWSGEDASFLLNTGEGDVIVADGGGQALVWCNRVTLSCETQELGYWPQELVGFGGEIGVVGRRSLQEPAALELFDAGSRRMFGRWPLPRLARGANYV